MKPPMRNPVVDLRCAPLLRASAICALAIGISACSGTAEMTGTTSAPLPAPAPPAAQAPAEDAGVLAARADSLRYAYTEADIRFMTDMIGHHAQAIEMAKMAPTHAASNAVQTLARRILSSQEDEIRTMQQWLRDRRQPVPQVGPDGKMIADESDHSSHHGGHDMHAAHMQMAGMLTPDQMAQLDAARGAEFDRLFLSFMIQHHRGAVSMVRDLFGTPGAGQDELVFRFATDVNVDQLTEIERMQSMLVDLLVISEDS